MNATNTPRLILNRQTTPKGRMSARGWMASRTPSVSPSPIPIPIPSPRANMVNLSMVVSRRAAGKVNYVDKYNLLRNPHSWVFFIYINNLKFFYIFSFNYNRVTITKVMGGMISCFKVKSKHDVLAQPANTGDWTRNKQGTQWRSLWRKQGHREYISIPPHSNV